MSIVTLPQQAMYSSVGNGKADLYKVNKVPHGTLAHRWYHSDGMKMDRRINIYTPAGYEQSGNRKYPACSTCCMAWAVMKTECTTFGRAAQILDNLIAQGKAEPMIVVMPNGHAAMESSGTG